MSPDVSFYGIATSKPEHRAAAFAALLGAPGAALRATLRMQRRLLCGGDALCDYSALHLRNMEGECKRRAGTCANQSAHSAEQCAERREACEMTPDFVTRELRRRGTFGCDARPLYLADDHQRRSSTMLLRTAFPRLVTLAQPPRNASRNAFHLARLVDLLMMAAGEPCAVHNPQSSWAALAPELAQRVDTGAWFARGRPNRAKHLSFLSTLSSLSSRATALLGRL